MNIPECRIADVGFRWDAERQHHVPQLVVEFEPVPANSPNDAKGWKDCDALAKLLAAAPPAPAAQEEPDGWVKVDRGVRPTLGECVAAVMAHQWSNTRAAMDALTQLVDAANAAADVDTLAAPAAQPVAPAGWVMVPREPTPEMMAAADKQLPDTFCIGDEYRAMIAAAPPAPAARQLHSSSSIDCEALIAAVLPGGSICDTQQVADSIRSYLNARPPAPAAQASEPIDMVLHCPACGLQHVDAPEAGSGYDLSGPDDAETRWSNPEWTNPPHRSHLCHGCGHIWRPADVATNGVAAVKTKGKADSSPPQAQQGLQAPLSDPGAQEGEHWPPGMLQDDSRELSRWLASKPDARQLVREAAARILERPVR